MEFILVDIQEDENENNRQLFCWIKINSKVLVSVNFDVSALWTVLHVDYVGDRLWKALHKWPWI